MIKRIYITLCFFIVTNILWGQLCPNFDWAIKTSGGTSFPEGGTDIEIDNQGNSYITGRFQGTINLGDTSLTSPTLSIFAAKINAQGEFVWAVKTIGLVNEKPSITVDHLGNSYITGRFYNTATFGAITLTAPFSDAIFVAKISPQGQFTWASRADIANSAPSGLSPIASVDTDNLGNVYITGCLLTTTIFGSTTLSHPSSNMFTSYVAKLNNQGQWQWAVKGGQGFGTSINIDGAGNIYITGSSYSTSVFGSTSLTPFGHFDIFVAKMNAQGQWIWAVNAGGVGQDDGNSISVDATGNSYITGKYTDGATFGTTSLSDYNKGYIAKLNNQGQWQWAKKVEGVNFNECFSIDIDGMGNSYTTGRFFDTSYFGNTTLIASPNGSAFITKINTQGQWQWAIKVGEDGIDINNPTPTLSADTIGNIYITGAFLSTSNFGNISLTSPDQETFVAKASEGMLTLSPMNGHTILCGGNTTINSFADNYSSLIWSPSIGLNDTSILHPIATPNQTTTYTLSVGNLCGNTLSQTTTVSISPFLVNTNSNATILCGNSVQLNANASQTNSQISFGWSPSSNLSDPNIANPIATPSQTTTYTVTAQDECGQIVTKPVTITVTPYTLNANAPNNTIDCGSSTQLNASITQNIPNISYHWTPNIGLNNANISNPTASPGLTTTYTVTATTPNGCSVSDNVTINVNNPNPPTVNIVSNTGNFLLCNGGIQLSAPGFLSYQWSNGSTSSSITVNQPGTYSVIAYGADGCPGQTSVVVTPLTTITAPNGNVLCIGQQGQTITLNAGNGFNSYNWNTGANTQTISVSQAGTYTCTVNNGSCAYTANIQVVQSTGNITASYAYSGTGLTVNFSNTTPNISFLSWNFGDGNTTDNFNPTHTFSAPGQYQICLSATDNCAVTDDECKLITVPLQTASMSELDLENTISVYPNPGNGTYFLQIINKENTDIQLKIFDVSGRLLQQINDFDINQAFKIDQATGLYILQVQIGNKFYITRIINNK